MNRRDTEQPDPHEPRFTHVFATPRTRLDVEVVSTTYLPHPDANADAWRDAKARLGDKLFDGPMCRFEGLTLNAGGFRLRVSRTSYRGFIETNLFGPRTLPTDALARPIGVSVALETADRHLVLGRRGDGVAYYPNRTHPFAGSLEWSERPGGIDPFADCRRELREELGLADDEVHDLALTGVAEDLDLRHPELIFAARTTLDVPALRRRLDRAEHDAVAAFPATQRGVETALADDALTPVARAAVRLFALARIRANSRVGSDGDQGV